MKRKIVYVAAPLTNIKEHKDGEIDSDFKQKLSDIEYFLKERGFEVYLPHKEERWGLDIVKDDECTTRDYEKIKSSDIILAMPSDPPSGGVHIELSWASAYYKKIILLLDKNKKYSPLIYGFEKVFDAELINYEKFSEIFDQLDERLVKLKTSDMK